MQLWYIGTGLVHLAMCGAVVAADWPEFRGPTGQGHSTETGLPLEWDESRNLTWRVPIDGDGWSSPVIVGERTYLTTAVSIDGGHERDRSLRTICLDARSGREIWNVEVFRQDGRTTAAIHSKNSHASPTPVCRDGRIYVHFGTHGTACLMNDGNVVWRNRELRYDPRHGNGGSPALTAELLVVSCDGIDVQFVVALDRDTGRPRWKRERPAVPNSPKFAFSTPLVIDVDGRRQLISSGAGQIIAYEPETGNEIWKVRYDGYSVVPRPVYGHGLVYFSTSFDRATLMAIRPTGRGDVTDTHVVWSRKKSAPETPSALLVGDELYVVSDRGIGSCIDAATGDLHWQQRLGSRFSASPLFADGRIYFQSEDGKTTVIAPGTSFRKLAENQINARTLASLAPANGAMYLRSNRHLYRFDAQ